MHWQARVGHNVVMNKRELAKAVAVQSDVELKTVVTVIDGFTEVVTAVVAKGEPISIPGFAKFVKVDRPARMGRNPATGEAIRIKASKKARITPVKAFKDAVLAPAKAPKLAKGAFPTDDAAVASAGKSAAPVAARGRRDEEHGQEGSGPQGRHGPQGCRQKARPSVHRPSARRPRRPPRGKAAPPGPVGGTGDWPRHMAEPSAGPMHRSSHWPSALWASHTRIASAPPERTTTRSSRRTQRHCASAPTPMWIPAPALPS